MDSIPNAAVITKYFGHDNAESRLVIVEDLPFVELCSYYAGAVEYFKSAFKFDEVFNAKYKSVLIMFQVGHHVDRITLSRIEGEK